MAETQTDKLKRLAREHGLVVKERKNGRVQEVSVLGGARSVTWWPDSKHRTALVHGNPKGRRQAAAGIVIRMALGQMK